MTAFNEQFFHLGGDEQSLGVDPDREGYPAGQAVGAIGSLTPAGDLVRSIVSEAEATIARIDALH